MAIKYSSWVEEGHYLQSPIYSHLVSQSSQLTLFADL